jgi:TatD DNase family protein
MKIGAFVDAHCHVDLFERPDQIIAEAETKRLYTIAVTNVPSVFRHTAMLVSHCRYVRPAIGLHPELVHSHGNQIEMLQPLLKETRYVGEIGLDYTTADKYLRNIQRNIFTRILGWCAEYKDKVLTLHSRRAVADTIAAVGKDYPGRPILHWFTGTVRELEQAASNGLYFSVNFAMVQSKKGQLLISRMPVERVLTETDGPFVKFHSHPAKPSDINHVLEGLANLWHISFEETREKVLANFRSLLGVVSDRESSSHNKGKEIV